MFTRSVPPRGSARLGASGVSLQPEIARAMAAATRSFLEAARAGEGLVSASKASSSQFHLDTSGVALGNHATIRGAR